MARNTSAKSGRAASAAAHVRDNGSNGALWVRRNPSSGRFVESKKNGGAFKGVRREG